jgi:tetratricopeptide (TPR) repeat protein
MAFKTKKIENLSQEELDHLLAKGDQLDLESITSATQQETEALFEYLHACVLTDNPLRATAVFDTLKTIIDAQLATGENREVALENLMDWSLQAIRLVPEERNKFVCFPIYHELFEAFADAEGKHAVMGTKSRLQLLHHIEIWLGKGGSLDKLEEEDRALVESIQATVWDEVEDALVTCNEKGYWDEALSLHRSAGRYYLLNKKVNEAISHLKQAAEVMPSTPDFDPLDQGDLYIEIGKIFFVHKKYPTARKYFELAIGSYAQVVDADENISFPAEAWIEECEKFM